MARKRVMHVHFWGDVSKQAGSVDKVLAAFAQMDDPDIEVEIASLGEGGTDRMGNAALHFFAEDRLKNKLLNKMLGLKAFTFSEVASLVNRRRPDLLHIHNRHALVDRLVARLDYRPFVLCHYHRKFESFVVPSRADGLVAVSGAVRDSLIAEAAPKSPVDVIYNPVPIPLAEPGDDPSIAADGRNGKPRLLFGGGRQRNKGFYELEAALSTPELAGRFDVTFCGPEFDGYEPPFAAKVRGQLPSAEFLAELQDCDLLVMPSHHEGFSILALEALAMGKMIVGTRGGGLGEVLDSANSLIHAAGDAKDLAARLAEAAGMLSERGMERRRAMRAAAISTAARFSVSAVNRDLAALYHRYCGTDKVE